MQRALQVFGFIVFLGYSGVQLIAGYGGIDFHFGSILATIIIFFTLMIRFTLPITIGAFFCAIDVWSWHWVWAVLFVAPGLAFIIPGILISILSSIRR